MLFAITVFVLLSSDIVSAQECHDIDPTACLLMSKQRPEMCSDPALSKTACPEFCKLCPVVCYQCNATVKDYHLCSTTIRCPQGHMCMSKELKSVADGHHEYEMTCASAQECDDPWNSLSVFGKRHIVSRDVSVTCCADDLCNYPEHTTIPAPITTPTATAAATTTTARLSSSCAIDLVFVVDESDSLQPHEYSIRRFLLDVVSRLPVSDSEVHVALGLFSSQSTPYFDLHHFHSKPDVLRVLNTVTFHGGIGEINEGLSYVKDHALTPAAGDRPTVPNIVIILTDGGTHDSHTLTSLEREVHKMATVISVEIGRVHYRSLASDTHHQFRVASPSDLNSVDERISALIC